MEIAHLGTVITTVIPIAALDTTLSGPFSVPPLTNYTYTVTVSNQGPSTASNVVLTETLAPSLTFVSASAGGTYLAGVVTWPALPSLASGATTNFTVTVRSPLSGTLTNTASSTAATADPNATNNNGSAPAARVVTVVSPLQIADTSFGASVSTLNWSHTVAPGSSRILVVGVSIDNPTNAIVSARFANVMTLTPIGQTNGAQTRVAMYYLINPPVGTYAVSITLASASGIVGGAVSLNGVNQTNPIAAFVGNTGTGTNVSLTVAKFVQHFMWISYAMDRIGEHRDEMWDEEDGFYYDLLRLPNGEATRLKVRSMVGLLPLSAATVFDADATARCPRLMELIALFRKRHPEVVAQVAPTAEGFAGYAGRRLLSPLTRTKLERILSYLLDEDEFLGPYGIRSVSRFHLEHPFVFRTGGQEHRVQYLPAESNNGSSAGTPTGAVRCGCP